MYLLYGDAIQELHGGYGEAHPGSRCACAADTDTRSSDTL